MSHARSLRRCARLSVVVLTLVVATADCGRSHESPAPTAVPQVIGTWSGDGPHTIGFISHSGKFRVRWRAAAIDGVAPGVFRLGVNSAVSGRPLDLPVDHHGPGEGAFNFEDDPRQYNLMVEATGLTWTIEVDELVLVPR